MKRICAVFIGIFSVSLILTFSASAATIKGVAIYEGKAPKFRQIKMDADPICLTKHTGAVFPQKLVLGEGNTISNIFVRVISGLPKKAYETPTEPVVLDQKGCMYSPHVLGVMKGQPVKILNPDGTLHNVHALSKKNPEFNLAMPKFRKETTKVFDQAEFMFAMKCDVHPWMGAWITVMDHPYYDVTAIDGVFEISGLPAGTYEIEAWQEKLGPKRMSVTVTADETKEVEFKFSRPQK